MRYAFDYRGLYEALDTRRTSRQLSWREVSQETGVAASTLTRTQRGGPMEADGVRAMVAWLGRAPEHFVRTEPGRPPPPPMVRVSAAGDRIRRLDSNALYRALDRERRSQQLTWSEVATAIGPRINARMLTRLKTRGRVGVHVLVPATGWLGVSIESLTYESKR